MNIGYYNIFNGELKPIKPIIPGDDETRVIVLFSCGITSFIATIQAIIENNRRWHLPLHIIYTYVKEEPIDNLRFLEDAEKYFNQKVTILINEDYEGSIYKVFEKGWLVGPGGAACTTQLKWKVRKKFVTDNDIQVFGFEAGEEDRMDQFANGNNDINISCPLICMRMTKIDCIEAAQQMGIKIPDSYDKGFKNANCIGCVKGQAGYWNHVRKTHPATFDRMSNVERDLNVAVNKKYKIYNNKNEKFINDHLINDGKPKLNK